MTIAKYENCISLGWFCGTASAMSTLGLRCFSGPFDWCHSNLDSILKIIETDFTDFMLKDNLKIVPDQHNYLIDTKYEFYYYHDIKSNLETEYQAIYDKYNRRITKFIEASKKTTCFFRAVRSNEEIEYIKENKEYIFNTIRKNNSNNEIVFLLLQDMPDLPNDITWFKLNIKNYTPKLYEMTTLFNNSPKLLEFCNSNLLTKEKIDENKKYISPFQTATAQIQHLLDKNHDQIELSLLHCFPNIKNAGLYIWGAGTYGKLMLNYMLNRGMSPKAIIDNNPKIIGTTINNIPIISSSEIEKIDAVNVLITVASEKSINSITQQIYKLLHNFTVATFDDLYKYINSTNP
ncbi:MAG: hypothetical protein E7314_02450 [Clostridiales bacterium]|nr:hypothetical protein [Clostridiales bacterium]